MSRLSRPRGTEWGVEGKDSRIPQICTRDIRDIVLVPVTRIHDPYPESPTLKRDLLVLGVIRLRSDPISRKLEQATELLVAAIFVCLASGGLQRTPGRF